jgi:hypothetical protein
MNSRRRISRLQARDHAASGAKDTTSGHGGMGSSVVIGTPAVVGLPVIKGGPAESEAAYMQACPNGQFSKPNRDVIWV